MENASKALIMAASVLLGVMIISIGAVLFQTFSQFGKSTIEETNEAKIAEWNNTYLKYYGNTTRIENGKKIEAPIPVTAHEIVTLLNSARQNNIDNELTAQSGKNENSYYVQIDIDSKKNAEKWNDETKNRFLQENALQANNHDVKYYKCTKYEISEVTKRVMYMQFKEY